MLSIGLLVPQTVKHPPAMRETPNLISAGEDPEKGIHAPVF